MQITQYQECQVQNIYVIKWYDEWCQVEWVNHGLRYEQEKPDWDNTIANRQRFPGEIMLIFIFLRFCYDNFLWSLHPKLKNGFFISLILFVKQLEHFGSFVIIPWCTEIDCFKPSNFMQVYLYYVSVIFKPEPNPIANDLIAPVL